MGQTVSLEDTVRKEAQRHNNVHLMMVDGISKLMTRQVERVVSADFRVGGLKWNIVLYPEGNCIHFALIISDRKCIGSNWKVNCTVKLTLYSRHGPSYLHQTHKTRVCLDANGITLTVRVPFKTMNLYTVNDRSVVSAEITEVKATCLNVTSIPRTMGTAESIKLTQVQRNIIWKIPHFSSVGEHHHSYQYTVGQRRWFLRMCPKGTLEGKGNSLSLYLHASGYETGPETNTLAVYKLRVLDRLRHRHHEIGQQFWFGSNDQHGDPKFLALEELHKASNGFLVNDEIHICVEFFYVSTTENMI